MPAWYIDRDPGDEDSSAPYASCACGSCIHNLTTLDQLFNGPRTSTTKNVGYVTFDRPGVLATFNGNQLHGWTEPTIA